MKAPQRRRSLKLIAFYRTLTGCECSIKEDRVTHDDEL